MAERTPTERAVYRQRVVSDPEASAWVDASAGSGKTKVLTDRALRLMLAFGQPERILCLTFTKAAAAEMANRIVETLARWATASDADVRAAVLQMTGRDPPPETVARARALFAQVVDAPGGLKVQTVHAFCQAALERFPIEAGAPPGFEALDDRAAAELLTEARDRTLAAIMRPDAPADLVKALDRMVLRGNAETLDGILQALLAERSRLAALGVAAAEAILSVFDFADEAAAEAALAEIAAPPVAVEADLRRLADAYAEGGTTDQKRAASLAAWLEFDAAERQAKPATLFDAFFTKNGAGPPRANVATKAVLNKNDWFERVYDDIFAFAEQARERWRAAGRAVESLAALRLAQAVGRRYERLKATRAALDFDDLILKTRNLLLQDGGAGWALFKLDQGVDHILVDEAQDTNPEQWQVVHALAGEFFQNEAHDGRRTLFAVGDPKQSIFSFQRADPAEFSHSRNVFREAAEGAQQRFEDLALDVSFRSVDAVLTLVDKTFASPEAADGLSPDGTPPMHIAAREGLPGRVELWPVMPGEDQPESDPWTPMRAYPPSGVEAEVRLAHAVADKIEALLADPAERVAATADRPGGRPVAPGDIMVVVQSRRKFGDALARALKSKGVETAGVDRMRLSRQLAVRDLLALGRVALLPEDDLALACLLKSPLCGLSEETLFDLAHGRGATPLWRRLKQAAADGGDVAAAWDLVEAALERADYAPPFDFYQWALGQRAGRAKLVAAMGAAALDPIDEFLSLALRYAAERPASLSGFIAWIERESVEIKRELEGASGGVRLLTAHAAKGLQASIVFLPDTTRGQPQDRLKLHWAETPFGEAPVLGASAQDDDPTVVANLRAGRQAREAAERRRLLYVAMTRAEDRLYVAGWKSGRGDKLRDDQSWHALVEAGFDRLPDVAEIDVDYADMPILTYADPGAATPLPIEAETEDTAAAVWTPPAWWERPAPKPEAPAPATAPSRTVIEDADDPPAALSPLARGGRRAEAARRFGRGLVIHKLLERLPATPPQLRAEAGRAFLARASDLPDEAADAVLEAALQLLDDPAFGRVFFDGALAEAPIAGRIGDKRYAGVIDRLSVGPDRVVIVDFKTNRPPPRGPEATPPAYLSQMALYRELARQAFPGRAIDVALLWTEAPRLDALADDLLDPFAPSA